MIATVEPANRDHLERHADRKRSDQRENGAEHEATRQLRKGRGEIGADHVERTVREVDEIHDAEDQRQPRRQQKEQHPELDAVQTLFDEIEHAFFSLSPQGRGPG